MYSFLLLSPTFINAFIYFILFSPDLFLEGITPIFVDERIEAQTSLMPVQGFKQQGLSLNLGWPKGNTERHFNFASCRLKIFYITNCGSQGKVMLLQSTRKRNYSFWEHNTCLYSCRILCNLLQSVYLFRVPSFYIHGNFLYPFEPPVSITIC